MITIVIISALAFVIAFWIGWRLAVPPARQRPRRSVSAEPEVIRPPRGGCGVHGCPNMRPHSHVDALVQRLRAEPKKPPRPYNKDLS